MNNIVVVFSDRSQVTPFFSTKKKKKKKKKLHVEHFSARPYGLDQSVRATHLILAGVGDDGSLCPGLLLFRQYRQKVHESARGNPLVPQWETT